MIRSRIGNQITVLLSDRSSAAVSTVLLRPLLRQAVSGPWRSRGFLLQVACAAVSPSICSQKGRMPRGKGTLEVCSAFIELSECQSCRVLTAETRSSGIVSITTLFYTSKTFRIPLFIPRCLISILCDAFYSNYPNWQVKPSSNPFFQTTTSNIGRKLEDVAWQAPEVNFWQEFRNGECCLAI